MTLIGHVLQMSSFLSTHTAGTLLDNQMIDLCLEILQTLLKYWKALPGEEVSGGVDT